MPNSSLMASDDDYAISARRQHDDFYLLPPIVECFVARARQELPPGLSALPWTLNRSVTVFRQGRAVFHIMYEDIERDIVKMLDSLKELA